MTRPHSWRTSLRQPAADRRGLEPCALLHQHTRARAPIFEPGRLRRAAAVMVFLPPGGRPRLGSAATFRICFSLEPHDHRPSLPRLDWQCLMRMLPPMEEDPPGRNINIYEIVWNIHTSRYPVRRLRCSFKTNSGTNAFRIKA